MWLSAATAQAQYVATDPGDCTGCGSLRDAIIAANARRWFTLPRRQAYEGLVVE